MRNQSTQQIDGLANCADFGAGSFRNRVFAIGFGQPFTKDVQEAKSPGVFVVDPRQHANGTAARHGDAGEPAVGFGGPGARWSCQACV